MKAVALISNNDDVKSNWQFDRVMAAISYDFDLSVIFMCDGYQQILNNKAWKCLSLYGVDHVYLYHDEAPSIIDNALFKVKSLSGTQLKQLVVNADIIL